MRIGNSSNASLAKARILREAMSKARSKANSSTSKQTSGNTTSRSSSLSNRISSSNGTSTQATKLKSYYTDIKKAADGVQEHGATLLATGEKSLFAKAAVYEKSAEKKTTDDTAKLSTKVQTDKEKAVNEISAFVEDYNTMVRKMSNTGTTVNKVYLKQMKDYIVQDKQALKDLGITAGTDGTLKVNKKTLASATVEQMQGVFGTKGGFADKVMQKSKNVEGNADNNLASINKSTYSSNYNKYGNAYTSGASGSIYNAKS